MNDALLIERILRQLKAGVSLKAATDAVLGPGTYERTAAEVGSTVIAGSNPSRCPYCYRPHDLSAAELACSDGSPP